MKELVKELLNAKEVMGILRCSYATLGRWEKKGILNPIKLWKGAKKLYAAAEIESMIEARLKKEEEAK